MTSTPRRSWPAWAGLLLPLLALLSLLAAGMIRHDRSVAVSEALARGETPAVPALSMPAFSGPPVSLAEFRGHPVILNFWASWCVPCREEAPLLEATWRHYRARGVVVLGVDTQDLLSPARAFISEYRLSFPSARDPDGTVARRFGTTGVPETFFVSADGRIVGKFPGEQVNPEAWRRVAEALLAGRPPDPAP
ncbi:MAG TPA: TlpA disulfide reductase family protein [bacterium]|nr:TlpA disulfide reductase family protein [bacterium]